MHFRCVYSRLNRRANELQPKTFVPRELPWPGIIPQTENESQMITPQR